MIDAVSVAGVRTVSPATASRDGAAERRILLPAPLRLDSSVDILQTLRVLDPHRIAAPALESSDQALQKAPLQSASETHSQLCDYPFEVNLGLISSGLD